MKLSLKTMAVIALVSVAAFSCKKEKKDSKPEPTRKELLTNKWKISDVKLGGTSVLGFSTDFQCITDNILTFKSDNTFTLEEGAKVCTPKFEGSGSWALAENDTKVKLIFDDGEEALIPIEELSSSILRVKYNLSDVPIPGNYELILQRL